MGPRPHQNSLPPVTMGIIGMGYTGCQHFLGINSLSEIEVLAVADVQENLQLELGQTEFYKDWKELLNNDQIESISICLPHHLHAQISLECLRAGKHVLLEKPLGSSLEDSQLILKAVESTKSVFMVEMTHRFYPPVKRAREIVNSGDLGRIIAIEDRVMDCFNPEQANSWLAKREFAGGGVALTNGIHLLDRISWVSGKSLELKYGLMGHEQALGDIEDTAMMLLTLSDNTPVSLLTSFMIRETFNLDDELTIYGTEGTLRVWAWRGYKIEWKDGHNEEYSSYPKQMALGERIRGAMRDALSTFAKKIRGENVSFPSAHEVYPAHKIIDQFYSINNRK